MNPGTVDRMDYWCIVGLLVDGIGRREHAVVHRASFSYQAESFALGLRDKLDNFTHIRLQLLCRVPAGPGRQMGRRVRVNRRGKRKTSFQILESQDRGIDHLSQAEIARTSKTRQRSRADTVRFAMPAYSAKARFSRGAAKSRKARTLIGRNRLAAYTRFTGSDGGWNSSSTVVNTPSSGRAWS